MKRLAVYGFGLTCVVLLGACPGIEPAEKVVVSPVRRLRRLSNREYNNVVRDLLGDTTRPADKFITDVYPNGYDNGAAGLAVQSDQVVSYQEAAEALAATAVTKNLPLLLGGCDVAQKGQPVCTEAFISGFAARAYRRPLSKTEALRLRGLVQSEAQASSFSAAIATAVEVILQSPQFLYREELGPLDAQPSDGKSVQLTDYEVASELSFLLTGSIPDATLWDAVAHGRFTTVADYQREARRLLASPAAKAAMRTFLHEWLATDRLAVVSKDPHFYPTFSPAMVASMSTELDDFFDDVLWSGRGSLRELFVSERSFVDATLAQLYGLPPVGAGFSPVMLDGRTRKGVLTRAGYLTVHSNVDSSGPVTRGVFLLHSILCAPPPLPPANVPPAPPPGDPSVSNLTTRQRFDRHASFPFCASCHKVIDGIGFGFEEFDGIGAFRSSENGQQVDPSGTLVGTHTADGPFTDASELAVKLAGTQTLADCFTRQAYRYAMGDIELAGDDLRWFTRGFTTDSPMTDALTALMASRVFVTRDFESQH
jgi:hypothetical protein